jgi:hypothetical protein
VAEGFPDGQAAEFAPALVGVHAGAVEVGLEDSDLNILRERSERLSASRELMANAREHAGQRKAGKQTADDNPSTHERHHGRAANPQA